MSKNELEKLWDLPINLSYNEKIEKLQQMFVEADSGEETGVEVEINKKGKKVLYPSFTKYKHYFSNGLYIREMFCKKNTFGFTVIHNTANPLFIMKGVMYSTTEKGVEKLSAPTFVLTEPGTKRMCWFPEDTVTINVHPNPDGLTNLDEIEKKMFSCDWQEYDSSLKKDSWEMMRHKNYYKKIKKKLKQ